MTLIVELRGGLGNQLFQVTAGVYFGKKLKRDVIVDDLHIFNHKDPTRRCWLRKIDLTTFFPDVTIGFQNMNRNRFRSKLLALKRSSNILDENALWSYSNKERRVRIFDWFISTNYLPEKIPNLSECISEEFKVVSAPFLSSTNQGKRTAGMHIRLGDYKNSKWGALSPAWYQNAARKLHDQRIEELHCFSDEIEAARELLSDLENQFRIVYPEDKKSFNPIELLWAMSQYQTFVSSNSTLSWWCSYLNPNEQKQVIVPWESGLKLHQWICIPKESL